jgi:uncharacterized membrane protein HdeD (DUF308 family)
VLVGVPCGFPCGKGVDSQIRSSNDKARHRAGEAIVAGTSGLAESVAADASALGRRTWWVFLIGGIASLLFGILAFVNPGIALLVLAMFFVAWILVDGIFNVVGSIQNRDKDGWWIMLLIGLLGIGVGVYALLNPPVGILAFVYLVALEAILLGVLLVALGYKVRKATSREWILYVTGALSILFGILIVTQPAAGSLSIVYIIASWAIVIGALRIAFAFRIRRLPAELASRLSLRP